LIELDHERDTVRVDWHRYAPDQVETWADQVVEAAYRHGFRHVEFVHGAVDVAARGTPGYAGEVRGRGQIKELLRRRLYRGHWRRWAKSVREGEHALHEGRMVIALRENPDPDPRARWPVVPPPAHADPG
jgi:hypothetical protein